jgi:hypothetical protein
MNSRYPAASRVSIWIGSFSSEEEFDAAVDKSLVPELELPCNIADICEITHESEAKPIKELLTGFSGDETFIDPAALDAAKMGIESATSALVAYHLDVAEPQGSTIGDMLFLGCYSGADNQASP